MRAGELKPARLQRLQRGLANPSSLLGRRHTKASPRVVVTRTPALPFCEVSQWGGAEKAGE